MEKREGNTTTEKKKLIGENVMRVFASFIKATHVSIGYALSASLCLVLCLPITSHPAEIVYSLYSCVLFYTLKCRRAQAGSTKIRRKKGKK